MRKLQELQRRLEDEAREMERKAEREREAEAERQREADARRTQRPGSGRQSCSTITGTGSDQSSAPCRQAKQRMDAARAARGSSPRQAADHYRQAAEAFRLAGDAVQAAAAMAEAERLESASATQAPPSRPDPQVSLDDEREQADRYYREGAAYENSKQYTQAESAYHRAASHYESAGDSTKQARALRSAERVACNGSLEEFDRLIQANRTIRDLQNAAQRIKVSKCSTFASAVKYLDDKVEEKRVESRPTIPRNAPPPPTYRREVDVTATLTPQLRRSRQSEKCPAGYTPGRNQTLKCVREGKSECYASDISCERTDGGCCFNTHNPPLGNVGGHFCCPRGYQCVFAEGPDRGICTKN